MENEGIVNNSLVNEVEQSVNDVKSIESIDDVSDFDLNALIVKGKNALITTVIDFYDLELQKKRKMRVHIKPMPHGEWSQSARTASNKKNGIDLEELICSKFLCYPNGSPIELSKIKESAKGAISQAYEKIKIISGEFKDPNQEKLMEKLLNG